MFPTSGRKEHEPASRSWLLTSIEIYSHVLTAVRKDLRTVSGHAYRIEANKSFAEEGTSIKGCFPRFEVLHTQGWLRMVGSVF